MFRLSFSHIAGLALFAVLLGQSSLRAEEVDIVEVFGKAISAQRVGLARKTMPVDGRAAAAGEVIVTVIKGDGVETKSKPAEVGDVVIRNRCPETGNEEYLVKAARMKDRYGEPQSASIPGGWVEYRPKGVELRYFVLGPQEGPWNFKAPWGEGMVANAGDVIVQDPSNPKDTYRVQGASFRCTYEIVKSP